jgi:Flp pilus assembly protein TadB
VIELGAFLAGFAVAAGGAWAARPSAVVSRLERIAVAARRRAPQGGHALRNAIGHDMVPRAAAAAAVVTLASAAGVALLAPALGYAAFVAPSVARDRRCGRERRDAERALGLAVEWIDALVSVGRPAERAFAAVARKGTGSATLDGVLREACAAADLGAPLFRALAAGARAAGLSQLAALADELDRARDLGRGSRSIVRDARDELRRRERVAAIGAASRVDAKLMLVLVACYLPSLMLVVVVPLFVGLLGGLLE